MLSATDTAARRATHWSKWAQKHAKLHYPRVHAMIWLRMTKNWYITDCYVQSIFCHTESNLCMNSRIMEFRMFLSLSGSVCGAQVCGGGARSNARFVAKSLHHPSFKKSVLLASSLFDSHTQRQFHSFITVWNFDLNLLYIFPWKQQFPIGIASVSCVFHESTKSLGFFYPL